MNDLKKRITAVLVTALLSVTPIFSADYNLQKSTPVGSWQLRQETNTDEKGKQSIEEVRTSLVGEETRNNVDYVWIEIATDSFKMKKGKKGKQTGEHVVVKILMEKSLMSGDSEDIFNNLQALGSEIIMQTGDQEPMKIEAGGMMGGMMQAMGPEIDYKFKDLGKEKIKVPAGKFKCKVVEGAGAVEMKVIFKTIRMNGKSKQWTSNKVPFGMVKMESESEMNGKITRTEVVLLDYNDSGAVSEIRGQPQSLKMPSLGDIFGG